jgi:serine phosphatase RsbU (regulator of sigma subunit)
MAYRIFFILLFSMHGLLQAQKISLSGTVFGFKAEKVIIIKKAQKNVSFDGGLEGTAVTVLGINTNATVTTGLSGAFTVQLAAPGMYTIKFFRSGYSGVEFNVNYTDAGKKRSFESLVFLLKQETSPDVSLGTFTIAEGGRTEFIPNSSGTDKSKGEIFQTNSNLLKKAAEVNNTLVRKYVKETADPKTPEKKEAVDSVPAKGPQLSHGDLLNLKNNSDPDIDSIRQRLSEAQNVLAGMDTASAEYSSLRREVKIVEQYLKDKEQIISLQAGEISEANKKITWLILFVVLAAGSVGLLLFFLRQRKQHAAELKEKNTRISKVNTKLLSSIRYASLIQKSFMQEKEKLAEFFPDSFLYNSPKDILSGDFYWFGRKNGHRILVVADCTGHGVPGALLTMLGHNALEDVINRRGEVLPSKILMGIHRAIQTTFARTADHLEYGMDITVISMKDGSNELLLSGVANGLYVIKANGTPEFHKVSPKSLGFEINETDLQDQRIALEKNDCIVLFTDGYTDQFSARQDEIEKFSLARFEKLIVMIAGKKDLEEAESILKKNLEDWKGSREQLDDVLIAGIKI